MAPTRKYLKSKKAKLSLRKKGKKSMKRGGRKAAKKTMRRKFVGGNMTEDEWKQKCMRSSYNPLSSMKVKMNTPECIKEENRLAEEREKRNYKGLELGHGNDLGI
jgi:hypothetical protein